MTLLEVPASWSNDQGRQRFSEDVFLVLRLQRQRPADGFGEIPLSFDDVLPGRGEGVLDVGHENPGSRIEGVDHHLAVDRAGDLDAAVVEVHGSGCNPPLGLAHRRRFRKKVERSTGLDLLPALTAAREQLVTARPEVALQAGHEFQCFGREYALAIRGARSNDRQGRRGVGRHGFSGGSVGGHGPFTCQFPPELDTKAVLLGR